MGPCQKVKALQWTHNKWIMGRAISDCSSACYRLSKQNKILILFSRPIDSDCIPIVAVEDGGLGIGDATAALDEEGVLVGEGELVDEGVLEDEGVFVDEGVLVVATKEHRFYHSTSRLYKIGSK